MLNQEIKMVLENVACLGRSCYDVVNGSTYFEKMINFLSEKITEEVERQVKENSFYELVPDETKVVNVKENFKPMNCKVCVFSQKTYNSRKLWCNRYNALVRDVKKDCNYDEKIGNNNSI